MTSYDVLLRRLLDQRRLLDTFLDDNAPGAPYSPYSPDAPLTAHAAQTLHLANARLPSAKSGSSES